MRLETSLQQKQTLELRLAPQIIQSIEILQLPSLDLAAMIEKQLDDNETLEIDVDRHLDDEPKEDRSKDAEEAESAENLSEVEDILGTLESDLWESGSTRRASGGGGDRDRKMEAMQNTASPPTGLKESLERQLDIEADLDETHRRLAEEIIGNLDDDGLLMYPLEEILRALDTDDTLEQLEEALKIVQSLEPRGVGARSKIECIVLQLDPTDPRYALKRRFVEHHLKDFATNKIPKVARELNLTATEVTDLGHEIGHDVSIRPAANGSYDPTPVIRPDVVLEYLDGNYEVRLEDDYFPPLRVSASYMKLLSENRDDPNIREHVRRKVEQARWLIEAIEQRRNTLDKVCRKIIEYQRDFLDHGEKHLHPLKMQQIADEVGVHVSTVSRAISEKYIQTHRGIFPLKFFFTGGTEGADGEESTVAVKQIVKEIVDAEDKSRPLSDEEISKALEARGLDIARRTVTKYRRQLDIPSSRQRRVWT